MIYIKKLLGSWVCLLVSAVFCLSLGTAAGLSTVGGMGSWYQTLAKPLGTPSPWVFGPVWTVLYLMMGSALGRMVIRRNWRDVLVFTFQFFLNLAWTPLFFGAHQILLALLVIVLLWLVLVKWIVHLWRVDRVSAYLLLPYLAWVSYATYLNVGIFWLNR